MLEGTILINAKIFLLTAAEGGRSTPLPAGHSYRPNHNFGDEQNRNMCIGAIEVSSERDLNPGDTIETDITMTVWPELVATISTGRVWRIQEGSKLVGFGKVIDVAA